jgi:hypothetical protein
MQASHSIRRATWASIVRRFELFASFCSSRSLSHAKVMTTMSSTPINTSLLLYILYSAYNTLWPSTAQPASVPAEFSLGYTWMPKSHPPTVTFRVYTPRTLAPFNGGDGGRILLAIKGVVFDVTAGRDFYGPSERFLVRCFVGGLLMGCGQWACMETLRGETRRGLWRSSPLISVGSPYPLRNRLT